MFPPNTPKTLMKPLPHEKGSHPDEAVQWFRTVYKRASLPNWPKEFPMYSTVQRPGEVMFVPSGMEIAFLDM